MLGGAALLVLLLHDALANVQPSLASGAPSASHNPLTLDFVDQTSSLELSDARATLEKARDALDSARGEISNARDVLSNVRDELISAREQVSDAPPSRVILTTRGITEDLAPTFVKLLREVSAGEEPTIAVIVTATMAGPAAQFSERRGEVLESAAAKPDALIRVEELSMRLGARVELVDAAHDSPAMMEEVLGRSHCIYVLGGNTFYLLHHLRRSGLDAVVQRRVLEEGAVYVGCSAGSIVAGRSISTAFWKGWDDPKVVSESVDWSAPSNVAALGLVSVSLFPHYEASQHEHLVQQRRTELDHHLVTLDEDGGAYIVGAPSPPRITSGPRPADAMIDAAAAPKCESCEQTAPLVAS